MSNTLPTPRLYNFSCDSEQTPFLHDFTLYSPLLTHNSPVDKYPPNFRQIPQMSQGEKWNETREETYFPFHRFACRYYKVSNMEIVKRTKNPQRTRTVMSALSCTSKRTWKRTFNVGLWVADGKETCCLPESLSFMTGIFYDLCDLVSWKCRENGRGMSTLLTVSAM